MAGGGGRVIVAAGPNEVSATIWVLSGANADAGGGVWTGSVAADGHLGGLEPLLHLPHASFAASHPRKPVRYVVLEEVPGSLVTLTGDGDRLRLRRVDRLSIAQPCHLMVHPSGGWLYIAGYGDGAVACLQLDEDGVPGTGTVVLPPPGSPGPAQPTHAHATTVSPCGGFLLVADLGRDELRGHRLYQGRPGGPALVTTLPVGFGPRHLAVSTDRVYITGESGSALAVVGWDGSGIGRVLLVMPLTAGGRAGSPSDVLVLGSRVLVALRGPDVVLALTGGCRPTIERVVATVPSPRHLAMVGDRLLVAGQLGDAVGVHAIAGGSPGPLLDRSPMPCPMHVLFPTSADAPVMP